MYLSSLEDAGSWSRTIWPRMNRVHLSKMLHDFHGLMMSRSFIVIVRLINVVKDSIHIRI